MATSPYRFISTLMSVGITLMSYTETFYRFIKLAVSDLWVSTKALIDPTAEYSLKEINATGHAAKTTSSNVVAIPQRRSRNSAAEHVSMLKSIGGLSLAA